MTLLREDRQVEVTTGTPVRHVTEVTFGIIGTIAAAIGAYLYYGPADGTLQLFAWDWNVAELSEVWPFGLLVGGGLLMFAGFGLLARKLFFRDDEVTGSTALSATAALVGLVGAVVFLLIWIF